MKKNPRHPSSFPPDSLLSFSILLLFWLLSATDLARAAVTTPSKGPLRPGLLTAEDPAWEEEVRSVTGLSLELPITPS